MNPYNLFKEKSFLGLFVSQATGAFNDNALKMILIGVMLSTKPVAEHSKYLSILNALLIAPFIPFSPLAGWVSDRFSKRSVLITFKATEFLIIALAMYAASIDSIFTLFLLLILMGTQSAFYSPSKYGILKELTDEKNLGVSNGVIEMGTIAAIIVGTVGGAFLYDSFKKPDGGTTITPFYILGILSFVGFIYSLKIKKVTSRSVSNFSLAQYVKEIRAIKANRVLLLTIVGITYFWFSAMLLNLLLLLYGTQVMKLNSVTEASLLFLFLSVGVSIGSYIAAKLSQDKVETALIPAGSIGMGLAAVLLTILHSNYTLVVIDLIVLGTFGGIFLVPLNTLLQLESDDDKRGSYIAISNMFNNVGMLLSSAVLWTLSSFLEFTPDKIMAILGIFSLLASTYIFYLLPEAFSRLIFGVLTKIVYKLNPVNTDAVQKKGGVLLTPNHMNFINSLLLKYSLPKRKIKFLVYESYLKKPVTGRLLKAGGCIAIKEKKTKDSIVKISKLLHDGEVVCIFSEGSLTHFEELLHFKKDVELIAGKSNGDIQIVPVRFDKLWGAAFSFKDKKHILKIPVRLPYSISVTFGDTKIKNTQAIENMPLLDL